MDSRPFVRLLQAQGRVAVPCTDPHDLIPKHESTGMNHSQCTRTPNRKCLLPLAVTLLCLITSNFTQAGMLPESESSSTQPERAPGQNLRPPGSDDGVGSKATSELLLTAIDQLPPQTDALSEIHPLDLSSPRATLWSMLVVLHNYRDLLADHGRTISNSAHLDWIQKRITRCFDMEDVAPEFQASVAIDAAVRLRSIIMHVPTQGWNSIPDERDLAKIDDELDEYRFKNLPIVMRKITEGERNGQWVISQLTRATAVDTLDHLMNNQAHTGPLALHTFSSDGDRLYRNHFFQSGWMIPSNLITGLPDSAGIQIIGQPLWKWALTLCCGLVITAVILIGYLSVIRRLHKPQSPHQTQKPHHHFAHMLFQIMIGALMVFFQIFIKNQLFLDGAVLETLVVASTLIMSIAFVCAMLNLGDMTAELLVRSDKANQHGMDETFTRILIKFVVIIFATIFVFQILRGLGFTPTTILAGAGVTGLAFALAAQDMLKNFFAGVILLIEKPFKKGDYIKIGSHAGKIRSMGIRSTSLMLREGNILYIPNSEISQGDIENITHRAHIRSRISIGLTYSTDHEQIQQAIDILTAILTDMVATPQGKDPVVFFKSFDESSLTLEATVTHADTNGFECKKTLSRVNLEVLKQFNEAELNFAFPTISIDMPDHAPAGTEAAV